MRLALHISKNRLLGPPKESWLSLVASPSSLNIYFSFQLRKFIWFLFYSSCFHLSAYNLSHSSFLELILLNFLLTYATLNKFAGDKKLKIFSIQSSGKSNKLSVAHFSGLLRFYIYYSGSSPSFDIILRFLFYRK